MENVVVGNLCQDPMLRQPQRAGQPVARFTVAVNKWRRVGLEYVQRAPVFHRVVCYGALAENVSNSLRKGMEVLAVGEWVDDTYSDEQGQRRVQVALEAKAIGPGLRWATASVCKVERRTDQDEPAAPGRSGAAQRAATPARLAVVPPAQTAAGPPAAGPPEPAVAAVTTRGKHELITNDDNPGGPTLIDPVPAAATDSAGRRRGGMHRRKPPEPESAVARAG